MEKKINVAELLKDCPKGMELYSPLCGKCVFDRLNMGTIICKKQNTQEITFTSEGYYMLPIFDNCECMIFPSKDQRDWSKFQGPFKNGDILVAGDWVFIFKKLHTNGSPKCHCHYDLTLEEFKVDTNSYMAYGGDIYPATKEQQDLLFSKMEGAGYKWDAEAKTLRRLPKFNVGDIIIDERNYKVIITEVNIEDECYEYESIIAKGTGSIDFSEQDYWILAPIKFDPRALKPADKVLVKYGNVTNWKLDFFSHYEENDSDHFCCVGGWYNKCIPFEGNEHLLGTDDECSDYYKTWEE